LKVLVQPHSTTQDPPIFTQPTKSPHQIIASNSFKSKGLQKTVKNQNTKMLDVTEKSNVFGHSQKLLLSFQVSKNGYSKRKDEKSKIGLLQKWKIEKILLIGL
jgi:hypothetical protein